MTTETAPITHTTCDFLTTPAGSAPIFTTESLSDEHRMIAQTAQGLRRERAPAPSRGDPAPGTGEGDPLQRFLLQKAGALGLLSADVPEEYGGLELGLTVSSMLADVLSADASFSVTIGAQTTIGSLPIVYFGNADQKAKYLPGLATGNWSAHIA